MERLIFHVDVNSAFLSWEAAKRVQEGLPDLREIPSCIGGDPQKRTGIVVAKSIPAKKYGIQTGEPMAMAFRKCPDLVSVPANFELYDKCSRAFKKICATYAPVMESFSIDEVFLGYPADFSEKRIRISDFFFLFSTQADIFHMCLQFRCHAVKKIIFAAVSAFLPVLMHLFLCCRDLLFQSQ